MGTSLKVTIGLVRTAKISSGELFDTGNSRKGLKHHYSRTGVMDISSSIYVC